MENEYAMTPGEGSMRQPAGSSIPSRPGLRLPGLLLAVSVLTGAWAWWLIAWPVFRLANVVEHAGHHALVYAHTVGGTVMLGCGAVALYIGWTRRQFRYHRLFGYTYVVGGAVGASLAGFLALANTHGKAAAPLRFDPAAASDTGVALAALAAAWLATTAMAFRAARNRRFEAHRQWMVRSYVLTWSFVLCRLVGRVPALADLGDGSSIIWLSWIGPLLACEVALQWGETGHRQPPPVSGRNGSARRAAGGGEVRHAAPGRGP